MLIFNDNLKTVDFMLNSGIPDENYTTHDAANESHQSKNRNKKNCASLYALKLLQYMCKYAYFAM